MRYEIIFSPQAEEDITTLKASDRAKAFDAIETYLRYEPEKTSKSRIKRLREMKRPQYRLRIDDLRVFYDVSYTEEHIASLNELYKPPHPQPLSHQGRGEKENYSNHLGLL